jgi:hypothetical protein
MFVRKLLWVGLLAMAAMLPLAGCGGSNSGGGATGAGGSHTTNGD